MPPSQTQSIAAVLPYIHATEENDSSLRKYLSEVEHEIGLEEQLAQERAEHAKTRAALQQQTSTAQRIANERQIETALNNHPVIPEARNAVIKLLSLGQAGELEVDSKGKLRERAGVRGLEEVVGDYLKENPNFLLDKDGGSTRPPQLDRFNMSAKEKGQYIAKHGQDAYLKLPYSKPAPKPKK
jgi:hypothetical protein